MLRQRRRDTAPEVKVRQLLHARALRYRVDYPIPGQRFRIDIAFTRLRVAAFVDGCFWHSCPIHATRPKANQGWWDEKLRANVQRDRRVDGWLKAHGWVVIRAWEHEDPIAVFGRIEQALKSRVLAGKGENILGDTPPDNVKRR